MEFKTSMIWATPIIEVTNPNHGRIKPGLVRYCYEREKQASTPIESGIAPKLKGGLYESRFDLFTQDLPEIREFRQFCGEALSRVIVALQKDAAQGRITAPAISLDLFESWAHITRDGGYHEAHIHPNCSWCGIYYLEPGDSNFDPPNGANRFFPPIDVQYVDFGTRASPHMPMTVRPTEGLLVLFPSYVKHAAIPYRGSRDRIVLAFNARAYPKNASD